MQLLAVTGIYGVTFLVMWFAPVANHIWERRPGLSAAVAFAAVCTAGLLAGDARLTWSAPAMERGRVAALTANRSRLFPNDSCSVRAACCHPMGESAAAAPT